MLGVIALALAGGVMPERGHLFDARSDLSTDDVARFGAELDAGQAAVAVLGHGADAERAVVELTGLGGKAELHRLTEQALRQAAAAPAVGLVLRPGSGRKSSSLIWARSVTSDRWG